MIYDLALSAIQMTLLAAVYPYSFFLGLHIRIKILILFALIIFCLFMESRSGLVSILLTYYFLSSGKNRKILNRKFAFAVSLFALTIVFLKFDSFLGRLFIWKRIFANIHTLNWQGLGYNSFKPAYAEWQTEYFSKEANWTKYHFLADSPSYAFNEYLHYGVELGIIPPLILLILLYLNIKWIYKEIDFTIKCFAISNVAIFLFSFVSYPLHSTWIIFLFVSNHLVILYFKNRKAGITMIIISLPIMMLLIYHSIKILYAKKDWEYAIYIPGSELNDKLSAYNSIRPFLYKNQYFLKDYCEVFIRANLPDSAEVLLVENKKYFNQFEFKMLSGDVSQLKGEYEQASIFYIKANNIIPNRFMPLYKLLLMNIRLNRRHSAKYFARIITTMPVKVESNIVYHIKETAAKLLRE